MGFDVNFSLIFCGFLSMVVVGVLLLWICFGGGRFLFDFLCCCCGGGGLFDFFDFLCFFGFLVTEVAVMGFLVVVVVGFL